MIDLNPRHALDVNERDHHVFPSWDLIAHDQTPACLCQPDVEPVRRDDGWTVLLWWHRPLLTGEIEVPDG